MYDCGFAKENLKKIYTLRRRNEMLSKQDKLELWSIYIWMEN